MSTSAMASWNMDRRHDRVSTKRELLLNLQFAFFPGSSDRFAVSSLLTSLSTPNAIADTEVNHADVNRKNRRMPSASTFRARYTPVRYFASKSLARLMTEGSFVGLSARGERREDPRSSRFSRSSTSPIALHARPTSREVIFKEYSIGFILNPDAADAAEKMCGHIPL